MDNTTLVKYLLNAADLPVVSDPYWNNTILCLRLDADTNSKGLPVYRDYSSYQYQVRDISGSGEDSNVVVITNGTENYPVLPTTNNININSFLTIPNKLNHTLRLGELNASIFNSQIKPSYLEILYGGNPSFSLGTSEFTLELSFYADEIALPHRYQTIFCLGSALSTGGAPGALDQVYNNSSFNGQIGGVGLFLDGANLVFSAAGLHYTLTTNPLTKNTWYHIALERRGNTLYYYQNFNLVQTFNFNLTLNNGYNSASTQYDRLYFGAHIAHTTYPFAGTQPYPTLVNIIDTSFSGGISNFRLTKAARYLQSFYTPTLPVPIVDSSNKIDANYTDVLFNIPALYDVYDYSKYSAHFVNKQLLKTTPNFATGFIYLDGVNTYTTKTIGGNLNSSEWTIEFYLAPYIDANPWKPDLLSDRKSFNNLLSIYNYGGIMLDNEIKQIPLIELHSNNKKVLKINLNVLNSQVGTYYSCLTSSNGEDWNTYSAETGINWREGDFYGQIKLLPNNELKFFMQRGSSISGLIDYSSTIYNSAYDEPHTHFAISRYNNNLYFLVNGIVIKTIPFTNELYQVTNNLNLSIGGAFTLLPGKKSENATASQISVGLKGVKVTNKAKYSFVDSNNIFYDHSIQPLPLETNKLAPPRARILNILRKNISSSISAIESEWYVYVTQPVDNLVLGDFTLTQLEGVTGAALISITKLSNYVYVVKASTGTGNGKLGLNFVDRKTVRYANTATYISYATGELSFEGEQYNINKNAPVPLLSSGSSPYISDIFTVTLQFDSAIASFDASKIGIVNGVLTQLRVVDELNHIYELSIQPIKQDPVIVQIIEGCGITDANIVSVQSAPLVCIYAESFPILQTPLSLSTTVNDLSPSKLVLTEVVSNNTTFSNTIAPVGETSSIEVKPLLEQSGLTYPTFNAVASTYTTALDEDWTVEFFLRVNSTITGSTKLTHIFSVENGQTGFSLFANNGRLRLQRSVLNSADLFASITWNDRDTTDFIAWDNNSYTQLQKYPHFAITKKDNVYRFYRNGLRIGLIQSSTAIDITKGILYLGYYPNRVNDVDFYLSNVRFTLGKALYTSYSVNVPGLPFTEVPNITEATELLSYISIFSNNAISSQATIGNKITLKFTSIIPLVGLPTVTILYRNAEVVASAYNSYTAIMDVEESDLDGQVTFSISITDQPNIPNKSFIATTNNSKVFIDGAPVTAAITTSAPNDNSFQFPILITFSEPIQAFNVNNLTLTNCKVSNILKYANESKYSAYVTALSTSDVTVSLEADSVVDLTGNSIAIAASLTRHCELPAYIPDSEFSNVLLLLQPEADNILDDSDNHIDITATNVTLVNDTSPIGLSKALYFSGIDSSLSFNLTQTLLSSSDYTIEFYINVKNKTVFRLAKPVVLPGSDIQGNSFIANWDEVESASSYLVDVALESGFNTYVPGYKNVNAGNATSLPITTEKLTYTPDAEKVSIVGKEGFVSKWDYNNTDQLGYIVDVGLDENFSSKLYQYTNRFTLLPYKVVGNVKNAQIIAIETEEDNPDDTVMDTTSGVVLTGLISNNSYPRLMYFLEESTLRLYKNDAYTMPAIAEDIDTNEWLHIAVVNTTKYVYLYVNGELQDKMKNVTFNTDFDIGYNIGHFNGYLTGLRITKGVARYNSNFTPPLLPYSTN